jgi:hypothetical protein
MFFPVATTPGARGGGCGDIRSLQTALALTFIRCDQLASLGTGLLPTHQPLGHGQCMEHVVARPREPNGVEPPFSEEDIQRGQFGPRGVPGAPDPAKMTP